jgi:hypothetical protein
MRREEEDAQGDPLGEEDPREGTPCAADKAERSLDGSANRR